MSLRTHSQTHILFDVLRLFVSSEKNIYPRWVALTTIFFFSCHLIHVKVPHRFFSQSPLVLYCGSWEVVVYTSLNKLNAFRPHGCHFVRPIDLCEWTPFSSCPVKESTKPLSSNHGAAARMDETGAVPVFVCGPDHLDTTAIFWHRLKPRGFLICSLLTLA